MAEAGKGTAVMEEKSNPTEEIPQANPAMEEKSLSTLKMGNELSVDEALEVVGSFGRFQLVMQLIFTYLITTMAYQFMMSYFIADEPPWRCIANNTSAFCIDNFGTDISKENANFSRRCQLNREEWTYSSKKEYSYVTEFDLVCEKTSIAALASGIYHLGGAVGVFISGGAADKYGRRYSLVVCLVLMIIFSIVGSFVKNITQLTAIRLLLGATGWSVYSIVYVYMGEFVIPACRPMSSNILGVGFSISMILMDGVSYYLREWRKLQLYMSFPCGIALLCLAVLPDSPRWHMVNNNTEQAEATIKMIGRFNRKPNSSVLLKTNTDSCNIDTNNDNNNKSNTYLDLVRNGKVFRMTVVLGLLWLTAGLSFYMITFESSNLGGGMYQSFAYSSLAAMPSNFLATYALNRFGRKRFILLCLVIAGALTGSTTIIPNACRDIYTIRMVLLSLANFFTFCALLGCYIWTFEIFPTSLRLQGWGICISLERIGSFAAPFLTTVLQQYNPRLPYICVMVLTVVTSAAAGLTLPDTSETGTRENFEDFFDAQPKVTIEVVPAKSYDNHGIADENV